MGTAGSNGQFPKHTPKEVSSSSDQPPSNDAFRQLIHPCREDVFFAEMWQKKPCVFPAAEGESPRPVREQTWADCLDMLMNAWGPPPLGCPPDGTDLLVFSGLEMTHAFDSRGPWTALLNGATCVVNHAEFVCPELSRLCLRLREKLLHVYANCYVTPPGCQAVPAHADDRDVFILQLRGRKQWTVYDSPPVELPYTDEQVGKNGLAIPAATLAREPLIRQVLLPGDVLYMPRGYVHEASCDSESSWHATLAVATHDWSWTKVYLATLAAALDSERGARWREAVPMCLGQPGADTQGVQLQLRSLLESTTSAVTVGQMQDMFTRKLAVHNERQEQSCECFQKQLRSLPADLGTEPLDSCPPGELWAHMSMAMAQEVLGFWRARRVHQETRLRTLTAEEKAVLDSWPAQGPSSKGKGKGGKRGRGLEVSDQFAEKVFSLLNEMRQRGHMGLAVSEFAELEGSGGFDELMQLCVARQCVVGRICARADPDEHDVVTGRLLPEKSPAGWMRDDVVHLDVTVGM